MNKIKQYFEIPEHAPMTIEDFDDEDWEYWEYFKNKFAKTAYKMPGSKKKKVCTIENGPYAGIIQSKTVRIHFSTKVNLHLFYMLSFMRSKKDKESFMFDPKKSIDMDEGISFFDVIGRLFLNELIGIFEKGLLKKYVEKIENRDYLKGKLHIKGQIINNINDRPKISCIYGNFTVNTLENQIILKALDSLVPMIKFNKGLKKDLIIYRHMMNRYIDMVEISPNDCDRIRFNRSNSYYSNIIQFSKIILEENFIRSTEKGGSRGFNFLTKMDIVVENFLTEMMKEIIRDNFNQRFSVLPQKSFQGVIRRKKSQKKCRKIKNVKPDIVLSENDNFHPIIIDIKYKVEDKNIDYYQITNYGHAIPGAQVCCLIYPETEDIVPGEFDILKDVTSPDLGKIDLCTYVINLYMTKNLSYDDFIEGIKTQLEDIIMKLINKMPKNE